MKLLKLHAKGFKSFADSTTISFPEKVTGVVGPNGCGKSNIADAIKWVFGEQSAKNLRGNKMDDVIFSGSQNRKATNFAEVSLLFDNSQKKANSDFNQIEITRRLYKGDGTNHYFINKEPVRLKDVQEITMDSGLGKGTLALISQGTVSSFAESKADDRRVIFEEAANVSKYKKRKIEAIRKLDRTQLNLDRVSDIIFELEKQYKPLKKQSQKAKKYIEYKSILQDKEITLMVYDILQSQKIINNKSDELKVKKVELENLKTKSSLKYSQAQNKKKLIHDLDLQINKLQLKIIDLSNKADSAQKIENIIAFQKNELFKSENKETRIKQLNSLIPNLLSEKDINQKKLQKLTNKILQTKTTVAEMEKTFDEVSMFLSETNKELTKLIIQKELTENNIKKNSSLPYGVRSAIDAKTTFPGIIGLSSELIQPQEGFDLAFSAAIGRQKNSIIVKSKHDANKIIEFLKQNKAGRATFIPLDSVKEKRISPETLIAANQVDGFISKMSNALIYNNSIDLAVKFMLGNILLAKDIKSANELSLLTNKNFRIVTLDGQVVNIGGSISGGYATPIKSTQNLKKLLDNINTKINNLKIKTQELERKKSHAHLEIEKFNSQISILSVNEIKFKELVDAQLSRIFIMSNEYKQLTGKKFDFNLSSTDENFVKYSQQVNELKFSRDEIKTLAEKKTIFLQEWKILDEQSNNFIHEIQGINNIIHNIEIIISREEVKLENYLNQLLMEYKLTFDFAKEKFNNFSNLETDRKIVEKTREEINKLGYINIEAINQFIEIEKRYLTLKQQHLELVEAKKAITEIIIDMDQKMIKDFDETFQKINAEFQNTFSRLFGGGQASLNYTNPDNILESGIEVKVKPPGKSITNLNLFSGGEKSMIALSVLFAILKTNPIPLVVLDEVEAPLDQVNIERLGEYLKDFTDNTQFIVITHRSGTMQKCNNIYGITMQEQGVSKVISINLEDAEKLAKISN